MDDVILLYRIFDIETCDTDNTALLSFLRSFFFLALESMTNNAPCGSINPRVNRIITTLHQAYCCAARFVV
jgi:hypothetical protein